MGILYTVQLFVPIELFY